ncbi:MAG: endonuclease, partial [Saprospiraceae bacterium]|nr:endonuclease [Saprospiraceae bacterium]
MIRMIAGLSSACTLVLHCTMLNAQTIFPGLSDQTLLDALVASYKPASVLTLAQAKDTLYARIDNRLDSVRGVYSGFAVHVPQNQDPSQAVFLDGNGINLEHSWPRSKGADEGTQGHSDMHHLFPSRVAVNSARASNPFDEIDDTQTTSWFYLDATMSTIPSVNIDAYSEATQALFEPRESVKGDIARAAFYFYTMYRDDADAADPDFFASQRATFLAWHTADPADSLEVDRTLQIATFQDGKENPYVLDPTLAERAFCDDPPCVTTSVRDQHQVPITATWRMDGCLLHVDFAPSIPSNVIGQVY